MEGDVSVAEGGGLGSEECLCGLEGVRMGVLDMGSWDVGLELECLFVISRDYSF